jgi:hypothetical protein
MMPPDQGELPKSRGDETVTGAACCAAAVTLRSERPQGERSCSCRRSEPAIDANLPNIPLAVYSLMSIPTPWTS